MTRLPAFSSLLAFDAVARHGTLTRAARELNVSQPAVSRRIALLESDLGCPLVDRSTRPAQLTNEGQSLFDVLRSGLSRLEVVVDRLRTGSDTDAVTISAGSGFAAYWLIPRLPAMQIAFPDVTIRIMSQAHSEETMSGDLQFRFGGGNWRNLETIKIMGEEVFPVASPMFIEGCAEPPALDNLARLKLLGLQDDAGHWYNWSTWFAEVGQSVSRPLRSLDFDNYALMVNAALAGQGICLCWSGLLDEFLRSGGLVRLLDVSASSSRGYFVTHQSDLPPDSPARALAHWLAEQSASDNAPA